MGNETPTTPTATNIFHLPLEMRLAVWEAIAPSGRDAVMECSDSSRGVKHCKVFTVLHHPDVLAARQTCHEAYKPWRKATIGTLLMPIRSRSLVKLFKLSFGVDSIATLWPDSYALRIFYRVILYRNQLDYSPTKAVYIGVSTVVCDPEVSPLASSELGECKYRLFDLKDARLPSFLGNCHAPRKKHHSDACYIAHLQEYWDNHAWPQELRKTWACVTASHEGKVIPELKPVVIGVQSAEQIRPQAATNFRLHVTEAKLAYSLESDGTPIDLSLSHQLHVPPQVPAQALREWRCQKCWPTDQD